MKEIEESERSTWTRVRRDWEGWEGWEEWEKWERESNEIRWERCQSNRVRGWEGERGELRWGWWDEVIVVSVASVATRWGARREVVRFSFTFQNALRSEHQWTTTNYQQNTSIPPSFFFLFLFSTFFIYLFLLFIHFILILDLKIYGREQWGKDKPVKWYYRRANAVLFCRSGSAVRQGMSRRKDEKRRGGRGEEDIYSYFLKLRCGYIWGAHLERAVSLTCSIPFLSSSFSRYCFLLYLIYLDLGPKSIGNNQTCYFWSRHCTIN